jgi:hypothetical protein
MVTAGSAIWLRNWELCSDRSFSFLVARPATISFSAWPPLESFHRIFGKLRSSDTHDLIDAWEAIVRADPCAVVGSQRQSSDDRDAEIDGIAFEVGKPGSGTRVAKNPEGSVNFVLLQGSAGVVVCTATQCSCPKFIDVLLHFGSLISY